MRTERPGPNRLLPVEGSWVDRFYSGIRLALCWLPLVACGLVDAAVLAEALRVNLGGMWDGMPEIVNGVDTQDYPSTAVLLLEERRSETRTAFCTGTLIGCRTVLTAAHCVCPIDTETAAGCIASGELQRSVPFVKIGLQHGGIFDAAAIEIHPEYQFGVRADVAVVTLSEPVTGIIPSSINTFQRPSTTTPGRIVGFGLTGVDAQVVDTGMKRVGRVVTAPCGGRIPSSTHVCWNFATPLGPPGEDSNTCSGDSGGPLFIDFGSGDVVAGITSGGVGETDNCQPFEASFDTDVFVYRNWIQNRAGADLGGPCGDIAAVGERGVVSQTSSGRLEGVGSEFRLSVESGPRVEALRVVLNGTEGEILRGRLVGNDVDLYVRAGEPPTFDAFDCRDVAADAYGSCEFEHPQAGTWHVLVRRFDGVGSYQLTVTTFEAQTTPTPTPGPCFGDCGGDGSVTVDDLVVAVNVALELIPLAQCPAADVDRDGTVSIDDLVRSVPAVLFGCAELR